MMQDSDFLDSDSDRQKLDALERWIFQLEEQGLEPVFEVDSSEASFFLEKMIREVISDEEEESQLLALCDFCLVAWNLSSVKALNPDNYLSTMHEVAATIDPSDDMRVLLDELVALKLEMFPEQLYALDHESLQVNIQQGQILSVQVSAEGI